MKPFIALLAPALLAGCVDSQQATTPPADPPVANDDTFVVKTNSSNNTLDVLANDTPTGAVSLVAVTDPGNGSSATINNGNIEFTPDSSFNGGEQQQFSYTIENADGDSDTATITVNIEATLTANPDSYNVTAGSAGVLLSVLENDQPQSGVTITTVTDPDAEGASTTAIEGSQIRFVPDSALEANDTQTFEYNIEDGSGDMDSTSVTITIVDAATANADSITISKNQPHNVVDVLDNDSAAVGALSITDFDAETAEGGRVWRHPDGDNLVYQPPRNFPEQTALNGEDSFSYSASDDNSTVTATVTVTINHHQNQQGRPCEEQAAERMANGLPYCFDVAIPADTDDEHEIHATVFVPADAGASKPPVMLHAHGFGESRFASLENPNFVMVSRVTAQALLDLWHQGYWVVTYDQRGFNASLMWGNSAESSEGDCNTETDPECIDVMNPNREGRDMVTVVDWITANLRQGFSVTVDENSGATTFVASTDTDPEALFAEDAPNDPVLGTIGLSYGGGYQTIGTSVENALNMSSRANAMVPVTTWYDLRYSLAPHDVPKSGWIQFLSGATAAGGTTPASDGFLAQAGREALVEDNVSDNTYQGLYQRSVRSYCEGNGHTAIGQDLSDGDGLVPALPAVFIIQGQRDLLFNYNEALDLAQCYESAAPDGDIRLLVQTEGHILSGAQATSHKGESEIIYIDETVYCDPAGNTSLSTTDLITGFLRGHLAPPDVPEKFTGINAQAPAVCTTHYLAGLAPSSGSTFNSLADVPVGGNEMELDGGSFTLPGGGNEQPLFEQTLITATEDVVLSGIPLLNLAITGTGSPAPNDDARFFAVLGIKRSGSDTINVIAEQVTPISGTAPEPGPGCLGGGCPVNFTFPRTDGHYPEQVGESRAGEDGGRMAGFSAKLSEGDELILQFFDYSELYNLHNTNPGGYQLNFTGSIRLPVVSP